MPSEPGTVEQSTYPIHDIPIKDLLGAIPPHCFKRSALRSASYIVYDLFVIACVYKATVFVDAFIDPAHLNLPHPLLYPLARFSLWSLYGFFVGLFATGLWVIAHECGHQAFSESKLVNNSVGWVLHSALGVPYHSWRITHAKHHASTAHLTQDQVFVPKTRSDLNLPAFNSKGEDRLGSNVSEEVRKELWEALGDSPLVATIMSAGYLLVGWPSYLLRNASGQRRYPVGTNHFNPKAVMFAPHQHDLILLSDVGVFIWLAVIATWIYYRGFAQVFTLYLVPYLWVNHWLVLITFLQHTDPLLPHFRAPEFTFTRGALSTLDRSLMGDCGAFMGWLGGHATHGISETHVLHHICSKIPHYNAWEATDTMRKKLGSLGINLIGNPGGWAEVYRVFRACKFVENDGDIVFYKNAHGIATTRAVFTDVTSSDSGVELDK